MANNEKDDESLWKELIEKVKQENRAVAKESIEEPVTKEEINVPKPIEKPVIDEISIEKATEEPAPVEPAKKPAKKVSKKSDKFTTIMITRDLKKKLAEKKQPRESYGDVLERLLKNK